MRISKWIPGFLIAFLLFSSVGLSTEVSASTLKEMEQKKNVYENKKVELNTGINNKVSELNTNQSKVDEISGQIQAIETKVNETNSKITQVEEEISETTKEVEKLHSSIAELEKRIAERDIVLRDRVRALQVNGGSVNYIDVLLGASSFSDFIDRYSAVSTLLDADKKIMEEQKADKDQLEVEKKLVETKLKEQEERKEELSNLKASLDSQKKEKAKLVDSLKVEQKKLASEKANLEGELHEVHEVTKAVEKEIAAEEERIVQLAIQAEIARKAELEKQQREAEVAATAAAAARTKAETKSTSKNETSSAPAVSSAPSVSSKPSTPSTPSAPAAPAPSVSAGSWTSPTTGRFSSPFGNRASNFASTNHRGLDIANSVGTPIVAAGNGVVQRTGTLGTYGNIIMIKHSVNGKIYTTLYAHLSGVSVSPGQVVTKGQYIGAMGNTGRSSGPHLHFEFHIGGWTGYGPSAVNPRNYVPF